MKKKIFSILALILLALIGGAYFFVQTQSDSILKKISAYVEEHSGAPLTFESLPSVGILPSMNISAGKTLWGTKDFSITFDKAKVEFSFFALLKGQLSLLALELENPKVIYNKTATIKSIKTDKKDDVAQQSTNVEQSISDMLIKTLNIVPDSIIIKNGYVEYTDKKQHVIAKSINTNIDNFEISQNSQVRVNSQITYTMLAKKPTKTYDFTIDTDFNFTVIEDSLNVELTKALLNPIAGFGFSDEMNLTASADVLFKPFTVRSFSTQVDSPFMKATINPRGDITPTEATFNITAKVFPLNIAKTFVPSAEFQSTKELEEVGLNADIAFKNKIISLENLKVDAHKSTIESTLTFDMSKNQIFGNIDIANTPLHNFIPKDTSKKNQTKPSVNTNSSVKSASSVKNKNIHSEINLPAFLRKTHFNVNLNASNIQYNEIIIDSIKTKLQGKNSVLSMSPIKIESMKSSILAKLNMDFTKKQKINTSLDIPSIDLSIWSKALLGNAAIAGKSSVKSTLNFPISNPISNINGSGDIRLSSLHIQTKHIPFILKILRANKINTENYQFDKGHMPFSINKSIVHLKNAYLSSPSLNFKTNGDVNLKNTNLNLEVYVDIVRKVSIPVSIKGNIQDPKIRISLANSISTIDKLLNITIKKDPGKNVENVLNKLFGK